MPIILCYVLIFVVWFQYEHRKASHLNNNASKEYWEKEYKSNFVRSHNLDDIVFLKIPIESLPFIETDDEELNYLQDMIRNLGNEKILNLSGVSNTELKYKFGTANITKLTQYDENYTRLTRTLYKWGAYLYQNNFITEAITVLEYGIQTKTEISGHYRLLAEIYKQQGELNKIKSLIQQAESLSTLIKKSLVASLNQILRS